MKTKACYEECINNRFLMSQNLLTQLLSIISKHKEFTKKVGRPPLDLSRMLHGIYYLLKTSVHWNALPKMLWVIIRSA